MKTFNKILSMFLVVAIVLMQVSMAMPNDSTLKDTKGPNITDTVKGSDVEAGDKVEIKITDESNLKLIVSTLNNKEKEEYNSSDKDAKVIKTFTYRVTMPDANTKVNVKIKAIDEHGNSNEELFIYNVRYNDLTAPEISMSEKDGSTLKKGTKLDLVGLDRESQITELSYNWEGLKETNHIPGRREPTNGCKVTGIPLGNEAGTYRLHVRAKNSIGLETDKVFTYYIEKDPEPTDDRGPVITADFPTNSKLKPGDRVSLNIKDTNEIKLIKYKWDTNKENIIYNKENSNQRIGNYDYKLESFKKVNATYDLYVYAEDILGNVTKEHFVYKVEYKDLTAPSISVSKKDGSILAKGTKIDLVVEDYNSLVTTLKYHWDGEPVIDMIPSKKVPANTCTITGIVIGNKPGKYLLHATAINEFGKETSKTFTYYVEAEEIKDEKAPTVEVNPNGGKVKPAIDVKITGKDNEELKKITYKWDDETPVVKNVGGKEESVYTEVPSTPGKHYLYVTVEDEAGNKVDKKIEFVVSDDEDPTITVNPKSGSTVYGGKVVEATLKDNLELKKVTYNWDGDSAKTQNLSGTSKTIDLPRLPYKAGTYKVTITVEDNAGNETTGRYVYYVKEEDDRGEDPTVDADPDGGELEYGDKILITADDDGYVEYVEYYWDDDDDDTTKKYDDEFTVKVPSEEGKHYLYVRARDDDDNLCDYERFTYYIKENNYPGNSDIIGDLNPRVRDVRVEIRNADDKIRFEPDEDILYYVDYYNGTSSKVYNAKLVVDLPTYLDAEKASDNGRISSKQVTWSLGTLDPKEYGRVSFVARYTSSKYNEKIITVPAKIYSGSSLKDTSTVRNMIFCEGASGTGSHSAYCIGYPDGTFRPEGLITRAELAAMISNIEGIRGTHRGQFIDANNHWAANYMQAVADRGYMKPRSYNRFGAEEFATRADLAYAIASILDVEDLEPIFISARDTRNSDARCAMEQLLRLGIMDGYSDGTAKPNKNITRSEAVVTINNYLFRGELYTKGYNYGYNFENSYNYGGGNYILKFKDLSFNHWAYGHIMEATNNHRYERVMDGNENML